MRAKNLTRDDQRVCLQIICSRVTSWELKTSQEMINAFVYKLYVAAWRHEELKTSQEMINAFVYKLYVAAWRHES